MDTRLAKTLRVKRAPAGRTTGREERQGLFNPERDARTILAALDAMGADQ